MAKTDSAVASTADTKANAATEKKGPKPKQASKKVEKPGLFTRVRNYFRNVVAEMRRVVWPSRQEVYQSSMVVGVTLLFFTAFAFLVDQVVIAVVTFLDKIGG